MISAPHTDFAAVAAAVGYATACRVDTLAGLDRTLDRALAAPGPHLIQVAIGAGTMARLGRPTLSPAEVAARFREFLASP